MIAKKIHVFGKVQGVFYRASTKTTADNLGINGWVRNEPDGTVLIHAEGSEENVEQLVAWCKKGPQFARVDKVELGKAKIAPKASFEVRY